VFSAMCANGQRSYPAAATTPGTATVDFLGAIRNNDLKSVRSRLHRHAALVQATDARGANVNARAKSGRTALIVAASVTGNIKAVRLLLDRGAHSKEHDESGAGALWAASQSADTEIVKELLARG